MHKITFYAILTEPLENVHLVKDVGMIPYFMQNIYGYESHLVAMYNKRTKKEIVIENDYPYILKEVKGLKIVAYKANRVVNRQCYNCVYIL